MWELMDKESKVPHEMRGNRQRGARCRMRCGSNRQRNWMTRMRFGANRQRGARGLGLGKGADLFSHAVKSDAVFARDVAFVWVVLPWAENQDAAFGNSIEKCI